MVTGRIYLGLAIGVTTLISVVLATAHSAGPSFITTVLPSELPLFAVSGSLGALMVFVSDKTKGVYEYLIAYGVDTFAMSVSIVLAAIALVSIVLVVALGLISLLAVVEYGTLPGSFFEQVVIYTVPLSFAAVAFMTMAGMAWAAVASPRSGMNSPVGLAPMLGIFPLVLVTITSAFLTPTQHQWLAVAVAAGLLALVALLAILLSRGAVRERFLSTL